MSGTEAEATMDKRKERYKERKAQNQRDYIAREKAKKGKPCSNTPSLTM